MPVHFSPMNRTPAEKYRWATDSPGICDRDVMIGTATCCSGIGELKRGGHVGAVPRHKSERLPLVASRTQRTLMHTSNGPGIILLPVERGSALAATGVTGMIANQ